jgi:pimeloyl-ACP methyl ester carboxylesterase
MGSTFSFGIDSFQSVDDTVTYLVFQPPQSDKIVLRNLAFKNNYVLRNIDGFSTLEIKPNIIKINKILIFSHGNASDILTMSIYMENLANKLGITTVCYDYTGYGLSEGRPSEEQCYEALNAVIKFYRRAYMENEITLVGQSLGTGVVTHYISTHEWKTPVILISPYKSIPRVICDTSCAESSFKHNTFSTIYKLGNVKCPVKIFHGKSDEVIDCSHSEYIYEKLQIKTFEPTYYENIGHNDILNVITSNDYLNVII